MNLPNDSSLERIHHLAGVSHVDDAMYDELRVLLRKFLQKVVVDGHTTSEHGDRQSINHEDILHVFDTIGLPILMPGKGAYLRQYGPWHRGIGIWDYADDTDYLGTDADMAEHSSCDTGDTVGTSESSDATSDGEDEYAEADDGDQGEADAHPEEEQWEEDEYEEDEEEEQDESMAKTRYYQRQSECVFMDRVSFGQVARECTPQGDRQLSARALEALQVGMEMFLVDILKNALLCAVHAGRHVVGLEDIRLALRIKGPRWLLGVMGLGPAHCR